MFSGREERNLPWTQDESLMRREDHTRGDSARPQFLSSVACTALASWCFFS
jgi:hypothetical protein